MISIDAFLSFSLTSFNAMNEGILFITIAMCNSLFKDRFLGKDFSSERNNVELIFEITILHIRQYK